MSVVLVRPWLQECALRAIRHPGGLQGNISRLAPAFEPRMRSAAGWMITDKMIHRESSESVIGAAMKVLNPVDE